MKKIYFVVFLFFCTLNIFAQKDRGAILSIGIPRVEVKKPEKKPEKTPEIPNTEPEYSITKPFEITKFKKADKVYEEPKPTTQNEFGQAPSDLKPGLEYAKKLNKAASQNSGDESGKVFRGNQFLGDFKTKADVVSIYYRDHGLVDGDLIKILVNDKIVVYEIYLEGNYNQIDLRLEKGFNKLEFEAINQGTQGPNTAQFMIYDDKGGLISSNQWNLATGFRASVILIKE
jgi:hypothetical protein